MAFIPAALAAVGTAVSGATAAAGGLGTVLGVGSAVLGGVGAISQGMASSQAAAYNADAARMQARVAQDQAAFKAAEIARQTRLKTAAAVAGGLENGFEQGGSMTTLTGAIQDTGNLDKLLAVYDGSVRATGYNNQAALDDAQSGYDEEAGFLGAATKTLSGVAAAYK